MNITVELLHVTPLEILVGAIRQCYESQDKSDSTHEWIDNDEGLYNWYKSSRQSKSKFIKENRSELECSITRYLNQPPRN